MKKTLFYIFLIFSLGSLSTLAQNTANTELSSRKKALQNDKAIFNEVEAFKLAKEKGLPESEIKAYVEFLKADFASKKSLSNQVHKHTPYENASKINDKAIYLNPNKTLSVGCPNAGFSNYDFTNWTGSTGTVSIGAGFPIYNLTSSSIINTAGSNAPLSNTTNFHTIMSVLPSNPIYPICVGYDTLACKVVGTQTLSQIPVVSPFSFDNVSVRMNGAAANNRACKLKYITTVSALNNRLTYSYALVFHDPTLSAFPHTAGEAPYFKVSVKNELTGLDVLGCSSYSFNAIASTAADSLRTSVTSTGDPVVYRKWNFYSVDLSSLPLGTSVSINFEVGGCTNMGHFAYAYVDAECGKVGNAYANMCSGSTFATLVAPTGFRSYQWINSGGNITGATNDTLVVNAPIVGSTYTVNLISANGCVITQTVTINLTTVSIVNLNATNSCPGGASGSAFVQAAGNTGSYTYAWTSTSGPTTGSVVGTSPIAIGLPAGSYYINVTSGSCGADGANILIGTSPQTTSSQLKQFCGTTSQIIAGAGSNYIWYSGTSSAQSLISSALTRTLVISNPSDGAVYTSVFKNTFGCKDSIRYTLSQITGGNAFSSNLINVCPGNSSGSVALNLNTTLQAPYSYNVINSSNTTILNSSISTKTLTVSSLASGNYTANINDGACIYFLPFSINEVQTNFTVTATQTLVCFPDDVTLKLNYTPTVACGPNPDLCYGPATQLFNVAPFFNNSSTSYPTPFSSWWYSAKQQFLVKAAELNAAGINAGKISSLAFKITSLNSSILTYPNYQVKMGCSNLINLPTGANQPFVAGLTTVYNNPLQAISLGWLTHNFSQAYVWDGISNIVIEICTGGISSLAFNNASIELKQMPYIANMKSVNNLLPGVSSCSETNSNGAGIYMANGANMLPNMRFGFCSLVQPVSNYTITTSSNASVTANYLNDSLKVIPTFATSPLGNLATIYTITVTNPLGLCSKTQTVAVLYPTGVINLTVVPTTTTICQGSSIKIEASGSLNYNWSYLQNGILTPISINPSVTITPIPTGLNYYIITSPSPCVSIIPDTKTVTVNVTPIATLTISPIANSTTCLNTAFTISPIVGSATAGNNGVPYTYNWTTLTSTVSIGVELGFTSTANTTQTLILTVNGNCSNSATTSVIINKYINNLEVTILDSSTTCANTSFVLSSLISGGRPNYSFSWTLDGAILSTTSNLNYTSPANEGTYTITLNVNDSCNYTQSDYEIITVLPPCIILIPNVITPNGDNINDFFKIKNLERYPKAQLIIFNRWGAKIYENENYNNDWNASDLGDGTFFYILEVPNDKKYTGFVTVYHN